MTFVWIDSIFLAILAIAAFLHLNATRGLPWCERLGVAMTAAGAVGSILEKYVPQAEYWADFILHAGLALAAIALVRGDLRALLYAPWNGVERRRR